MSSAQTVAVSAPVSDGTRPQARSVDARRGTVLRWCFIAPAVLYMLAFFGYPLVRNVIMSFQHYTPRTFFDGQAPFNGFANWSAVFSNPLFTDSLWHTLVFTAGSLLGQFTLGLALAVFFSRRFRLSGVARAVLLLPWLVPMVVSAVVWRKLLDPDTGVLNAFLVNLHVISSPLPWLSSPSAALASAIMVNIWIGIPFNMVILYGGLQEIPRDLYEAASLDGASAWRTFRSVTFPLLRPVVTVVLVLGFMSTVKILDLILALTDGGPADSTQTLGTVTYQLSFLQLDFGQGAVVGNVLILISAVFAVLYLRANRSDFGQER